MFARVVVVFARVVVVFARVVVVFARVVVEYARVVVVVVMSLFRCVVEVGTKCLQNISGAGYKCVFLNARSMVNKKTN